MTRSLPLMKLLKEWHRMKDGKDSNRKEGYCKPKLEERPVSWCRTSISPHLQRPPGSPILETRCEQKIIQTDHHEMHQLALRARGLRPSGDEDGGQQGEPQTSSPAGQTADRAQNQSSRADNAQQKVERDHAS
jgi:hypothetical protein